MYTTVSENIWGTRHRFEKNGVEIGKIASIGWYTGFTITLGNEVITMKTRKWYSSTLVVTRGNQEVATGTLVTFTMSPEMHITYNDRVFRVRAKGAFSRTFQIMTELGDEEKVIGEAIRGSGFKTRYEVKVPDFVEDWFVGVIICMLMKQYYNAAAAGAG